MATIIDKETSHLANYSNIIYVYAKNSMHPLQYLQLNTIQSV